MKSVFASALAWGGQAVGAVYALLVFVLLLFVAWLIASINPQRFTVVFATYKYWGGGTKTNAQNFGLRAAPEAFSLIDIPLDFGAIALQRAADGQAALANADVLEVARIKAGTYVLFAAIQVVAAEGGAATLSVGDAGGATQYINAGDINTVGWVSSLATTALSVAVGGGKIYTADDSILVTLNNALIDAAKTHLFMAAIDLTRFRS